MPYSGLLPFDGAVLAPVGMNADRTADVRDDGRRVGRHRRIGDVLIPGIVRGKELLAQQGQHHSIFQLLDRQASMRRAIGRSSDARRDSLPAAGRTICWRARFDQRRYVQTYRSPLLCEFLSGIPPDRAKSVPLFTRRRDAMTELVCGLPSLAECADGTIDAGDDGRRRDVQFPSFYTFSAHSRPIFLRESSAAAPAPRCMRNATASRAAASHLAAG